MRRRRARTPPIAPDSSWDSRAATAHHAAAGRAARRAFPRSTDPAPRYAARATASVRAPTPFGGSRACSGQRAYRAQRKMKSAVIRRGASRVIGGPQSDGLGVRLELVLGGRPPDVGRKARDLLRLSTIGDHDADRLAGFSFRLVPPIRKQIVEMKNPPNGRGRVLPKQLHCQLL